MLGAKNSRDTIPYTCKGERREGCGVCVCALSDFYVHTFGIQFQSGCGAPLYICSKVGKVVSTAVHVLCVVCWKGLPCVSFKSFGACLVYDKVAVCLLVEFGLDQ